MKTRWRVYAALGFLSLCLAPVAICRADDATHAGGKVFTPFPSYPYIARKNREQGFALIQVTFGETGSVADINVELSTGHPDLDDNVVEFARSHWRGPPHSRCSVPVDYRLQTPGTAPFSRQPGPDGWYTRLPSYPTLSRRFLERGTGVITVTTDASGRVVHAEMVKSTGVARLDHVTTVYALSFWTGPPKSTRTIPVSYSMRMGSPGAN